MYENDGTQQFTGLARSIDRLFRERERGAATEHVLDAEAVEIEAVEIEAVEIEAVEIEPDGRAGAPLELEFAADPFDAGAVEVEAPEVDPPEIDLSEVEPSGVGLPEVDAAAEPPALHGSDSDGLPGLTEPAPAPPPLPDDVESASRGSEDAAEGHQEEAEGPTDLDRAVDAYLDGDHERASEIERLAGEHLEARDISPIARSVGRIAFAAGEPPDAAMLALAGSISSPVVLGRLARQMGAERRTEKREEYFQACRVLGSDMARAIRDDLAENTDTLARSVHCEALAQMGPAGREVIEEMAQDEIWFLARNGVAILGELGGDNAIELVTGALANPDARVRREALRSLARLGASDAGELVAALLDDSDESVRMAATVAAGELGVVKAVRPLVQMLEENKDPDRAIPILRALGQLEDPGAVPAIEKHAVPSLFSKPRTDVRVAAYRALFHIGTPHAMKLLARASSDKDPEVQSAVLGLRRKVARED